MVDDTRKLEIGRVFRDTFGAIRREAGLMVGLTVVLSALPTLLLSFLQRSILGDTGADAVRAFGSPLYLALFLVSMALTLLMFACLYYITIAALEGRQVELTEALQTGARKLPPLIAVGFLTALGAGLGMLLLVVPGVILALMWAVSSPVVVGESSNVLQAFGRSRALTKGNRWRILGLTMLFYVLAVAVGLVIGLVAGVLGVLSPSGPSTSVLVASSLTSSLVTLVACVGTAALYVQLRELKGGGAAVAQVFA